MFIPEGLFDKLMCCGRKDPKTSKKNKEKDNISNGEESDIIMMQQHTNNNTSECVTAEELKERLKGGTTAVVALLRGKRLVVAWLGDSLAVLVKKRKPMKLMDPHKPDYESERERVENMGGVVLKLEGSWRVLGQLAVSRAIGDSDYKPYISSECDIKSLEIKGDEDFLILATDGLWDTLSYDDAITFVYAYLTINEGDCEGVGRCLVEQAKRLGSLDNITAVVVFLRPVYVLMEEEALRKQQGEIPEGELDPSCLMKKDAAPSTIYEIFSNNVGTFNPDSPSSKQGEDFNPFSPNGAGTHENGAVAHGQAFNAYGQGATEQFDLSAGLPVNNSADPTMEDVESALAELDSLPDGGEDRDDATSPDNWAYSNSETLKMDSSDMQEHFDQQAVVGDVKVTEEVLASKSPESFPAQKESLVINTQLNGGGSDKSSPPSSPRSVEGFVTSVELNTAQELLASSANTAFSPASPEIPIEQPSGPFSVYVSSSPEPTSLDPLANEADKKSPSPQMTQEEESLQSNSFGKSSSPVSMEVDSAYPQAESPSVAGVEIVHAQSMVEVVAPPSPTQDSVPADVTVVSTDSYAVHTSAPMNDLMSTSMILQQPISDEPDQVEQMMQFMTSSAEVYNVEQQQTAEMVNIDRHLSPEVESAELLDSVESIASPTSETSAQPDVMSPSPVQQPDVMSPSPVQQPDVMSPTPEQQPDVMSPTPEQQHEAMSPSPVQQHEAMSPSPVQQHEAMSPSPVMQPEVMSPSPVMQPGLMSPSPVMESEVMSPSPVQQLELSSPVEELYLQPGIVRSPIEQTPSPIQPESSPTPVVTETEIEAVSDSPTAPIDDLVEQMNLVNINSSQAAAVEEAVPSQVPVTPSRSESRTPVSDVTPATPVAEPTIEGRPVSPIHTPKAAGHIPHSEVVSEIVPPAVEKKKAPVKPAPRSTLASRAAAAKTATASKATPSPRTTTPSSATQKPGTPRPTARSAASTRTIAPGTAVRSTATTRTSTLSSRTSTTPSSRPSSTSATRTTTTSRTATSRNTTPSATRTTPSNSATRPTPSSRTARTTPSSATTKSTTPSSRPSSRPASATTTPTTSRRVPISRRPATATAATSKDSTDSKSAATSGDAKTTTRAPYTRKPLYPGPSTTRTTTTATKTATDKKELKNTTNKMLSSRTTTTTRSSAATSRTATTAPTHRTTTTSTTGVAKSGTLKTRTTTKTTTTGLKSRVPGTTTRTTTTKTQVITTDESKNKEAEVLTPPELNEELKIAQEENSVEVIAKEEEEQNQPLIVNGDAPH